jgi:hypothetical protein
MGFTDTSFFSPPSVQANVRNNRTSAWPVANPVFTCASVTDMNHPSNFVANPFLFMHVRILHLLITAVEFMVSIEGLT